MSFAPVRVRERRAYVSCRLDYVVTLEKGEGSVHLVAWDRRTQCCGSRGIFPAWTREASFCKGPRECILLQAGELFYPPDRLVWVPFIDSDIWEEVKSHFVLLSNCGCELSDEVEGHIKEQQRKWGIG